jgi:glycine/D-amino acid oxidase-like deaminating enzyme
VIVLDSGRCGQGASGRNGGFLDASLTHGLRNGLSRFPEEIEVLERLGRENFAGLRADLEEHGIDPEYEPTGLLTVALEPHELAGLVEEAALLRQYGYEVEVLDQEDVRREVNSPTYLGGLWVRSGTALVHPGKLVEGLRAAALALGVSIHEHSPAHTLQPEGSAVRVSTDSGSVRASRVLLGTSAYPPLLPALHRYIAPVYD